MGRNSVKHNETGRKVEHLVRLARRMKNGFHPKFADGNFELRIVSRTRIKCKQENYDAVRGGKLFCPKSGKKGLKSSGFLFIWTSVLTFINTDLVCKSPSLCPSRLY